MRKFEYRLFSKWASHCHDIKLVIEGHASLEVKELNELANEGWRVVGVVCASTDTIIWTLEREIEEN
jgi:uncharacterized protein YsxB (DUF464 family)